MTKKSPNSPEARQSKFPRISRIINEEYFPLIYGASFIILIATVVASFMLFKNAKELKILTMQREELSREKASWKNILSKYPDYRDGYLTLANIEYRLSEKGNALLNVRKAIEIDPNFSKSYELEKFILAN